MVIALAVAGSGNWTAAFKLRMIAQRNATHKDYSSMRQRAYIALDADGRVTLYRGDGTEATQEIIARSVQPDSPETLYDAVAAMQAWAEAEGFTVVVPAYDLASGTDAALDPTQSEADWITWDDIDALADDLDQAGRAGTGESR